MMLCVIRFIMLYSLDAMASEDAQNPYAPITSSIQAWDEAKYAVQPPLSSQIAWDESKYAVRTPSSSHVPWDSKKYDVPQGASSTDTGNPYASLSEGRPSYELLAPPDLIDHTNLPHDTKKTPYDRVVTTSRIYDELKPHVPAVPHEYAYVTSASFAQQKIPVQQRFTRRKKLCLYALMAVVATIIIIVVAALGASGAFSSGSSNAADASKSNMTASSCTYVRMRVVCCHSFTDMPHRQNVHRVCCRVYCCWHHELHDCHIG